MAVTMALKATSFYAYLFVMDTANNVGLTGDAANLTLSILRNGARQAPTNNVTEVDATNAPGIYALLLTDTETDAGAISVTGISSTSNTLVIPLYITLIPPLAYKVYAEDASETVIVERGTTWSISIDLDTDADAIRDKLYFTVKQGTLATPLDEVTDANALVQIEETDGLTVLDATAQATPNSDASLTVSAGRDSVTVALNADKSATLDTYERGGGLYWDLREVTGTTVARLAYGRMLISTEVTRAVT